MVFMPFLHAAFCFGHGAFAVWSCGVLKSSCGVSLSVMGRFAAVPGGRASSLPDSPLRGHVAPSHLYLLLPSHADGVRLEFRGDSKCGMRTWGDLGCRICFKALEKGLFEGQKTFMPGIK